MSLDINKARVGIYYKEINSIKSPNPLIRVGIYYKEINSIKSPDPLIRWSSKAM